MNAQQNNNDPLASLLKGVASLPALLESVETMGRRIAAMETALRAKPAEPRENGWMDAAKAAQYLDMSPGTFDKYRYQAEPKISGCKVGGKTLYKREDLDRWVKLFELKSGGFA